MACKTCNSVKSDKLPNKKLFDRVLERNEFFLKTKNNDAIVNGFIGYTEGWYKRQYVACDLDYRGNREYFVPKIIS